MQKVFNRVEKKYLLNEKQYQSLLAIIKEKMILDEHGNYTICNLYFDTSNFDLIRKSIEKPIYKEKVRLRSYGIPSSNSSVFLEIKKKYNKVVNKRRIIFPLKELNQVLKFETLDSQIKKELAYLFHQNVLEPKIFIAYDRTAYFGKDDKTFRITFDKNIRYRLENLKLELGDSGKLILPKNTYVMEVKTDSSYPIWFSKILAQKKIYPTSFSKYGTIYEKIRKENVTHV